MRPLAYLKNGRSISAAELAEQPEWVREAWEDSTPLYARREDMIHDEIIAVIAAHRDDKPLQILQVNRGNRYCDTEISLEALMELMADGETFRPKSEPRRVYVPCDANGCCGKAYSLLDYAEREWPDAEIVAFVEEEPK